jgi:SpoIID/LytB domain protein
LDSDGKNLDHKINSFSGARSFIPVAKKLWQIISGITISLFLLTGCAKKLVPPTELVTPKVPLVRVALEESLAKGTLAFHGQYQLKSEEAEYVLDDSLSPFQINYDGKVLSFQSAKRYFTYKSFDQLELIPIDKSHFLWNDIPYPGKITFSKNINTVILVNTLTLTDYLNGVIPHEIPTHNDEYYAAVAAQTIAARTYALYQIKHPSSKFYDIYDDTRDQVYKGKVRESDLAKRTIQDTYGMVLTDSDGQLAETQYHSTCGGLLNESSSTSPVSEPVEDIWDNNFNCATSPLYRWVDKITAAEILQNLVKYKKISREEYQRLIDEGFQLEVEITSRQASDRIEKIALSLNKKKISLNEWESRYILASQDSNLLPSTLFFLKKSPSSPDLIYLVGAGYGHGKGMCQWGAIGQALNGRSYQDILKFYYPMLSLKKVY